MMTPTSPTSKLSPRRESGLYAHLRGHSFEGGALLFNEKDDDLALFKEMQSKERDTFLLHSSQNFDDVFSTKLRNLKSFNYGISIPVRGGIELFNADEEKNDYEWLVTPPETPLFPSLDDEPQQASVAARGRSLRQSASLSKSSTLRSHGSSRGSASPVHSSVSPSSSSTKIQLRGRRPLSAPHVVPTSHQRSATPTQRSSPSPHGTSRGAPKQSVSTSERVGTWSGARGTPPMKTRRGNSSSPKSKPLQPNISGFSHGAPLNLRTSLADRPASYVRGSSPASRNSTESRSKFGRQSMSPTASRSVCSSHSQDRDFSSQSRGSIASSGDDDVDSLQPVHIGSTDQFSSKRTPRLPNNRASSFPKKTIKASSPHPATKRSPGSSSRQMDHQIMFRPLLSSVPSSALHVQSCPTNCLLKSRNSSSAATSSITSNEQENLSVPDTEQSDSQSKVAELEESMEDSTNSKEDDSCQERCSELCSDRDLKSDLVATSLDRTDVADKNPTFLEDHSSRNEPVSLMKTPICAGGSVRQSSCHAYSPAQFKRSHSDRGPVVQRRALMASSFIFDDRLYTREEPNCLPNSIAASLSSASSSPAVSASAEQAEAHHGHEDSASETSVDASSENAPGSENGDELANECVPPTPSLEKSACSQEHGLLDQARVEEAADTMLFCSSIIHELAYQAATVAIEKEKSEELKSCRPVVAAVPTNLAVELKNGARLTTQPPGKHILKPPIVKAKLPKPETEVKFPFRDKADKNNAPRIVVGRAGFPDQMDPSKVPKLQSKCNCSIL